MKIYTKTGDDGTTGVLGPDRLSKSDDRIEAYGAVDELNAALGVARSLPAPQDLSPVLSRVQDDLFLIGAALADTSAEGRFRGVLRPEQVETLEQAIDHFELALDPLTHFIVPGGAPAAAQLHLCRTICRRAERRVVALARHASPAIPPELVVYLNRLSDLLFVMARYVNKCANVPDILWTGLPR